ncbi:hypothetical protein HK104_002258 [Borealophlyctis nickersoniae]|nr:hypothetical protein HK104_002258 [Borealophlyctis nickersoniae]
MPSTLPHRALPYLAPRFLPIFINTPAVVAAAAPQYSFRKAFYTTFNNTTNNKENGMPGVSNPIQAHAVGITLDNPDSYDKLIDAIGPANIVLIGDGTHGTLEFYRERAYITQRLIAEKGFQIVAVEADWPDAYRVNRFVKGFGTDKNAIQSLGDFKRFPLWMWRNEVMIPFVTWLRAFNDKIGRSEIGDRMKVTFHGLDMYSLHKSAEAVVRTLQKYDPKLAAKAKERYACFDKFGPDTQTYALFTGYGLASSCEKAVLQVLKDLLEKDAQNVIQGVKGDTDYEREEKWVAKMNALVVKDAEEYYRCMMKEDVKTWNIRDTHMVNILEEIIKHESHDGTMAKAVVWAHNSHLGDASATDMGRRRGELNVGQLCRQKWGPSVYNIGFLTSTGTVTAAHEWDTPAALMPVNPALPDSIEAHLRERAGKDDFMIVQTKRVMDEEVDEVVKVEVDRELSLDLKKDLLERYIGVLYKADTERWSHYSKSVLGDQVSVFVLAV